MKADKQGIAVRATGQKAILDPGCCPELLHEEQPANEQQQHNDYCRKSGGLPVSGFLACSFVRMGMQRTLP